MQKVLFVSSEVHPLMKTGGLADVAGSLPKALQDLGLDVRIVMPHYLSIQREQAIEYRCTFRVGHYDVNILETRLPHSDVTVWLIDYPPLFGMSGNPYVDANSQPWPNNAERFALFCRAAVEIAMDRAHLNWRADIVHCNDWQTGLTPPLLALEAHRPATVFTIHNLAYQGLFAKAAFFVLNLPHELWQSGGVEFYGLFSFIKGGLAYADHITTVSPTYALEIQTPEYGYGLEGLLCHRREQLTGILNGIDASWNPETDPLIPHRYSVKTLDDKRHNKLALQQRLHLPQHPNVPLLALIGRLVPQKGIDLVIDALPDLAQLPVQFVLLGSGDKAFEQRLVNLGRLHPDKFAITLGYDEALAHWIEAGADIFLMPSRFEPCGLNQMYSQRYGTIPIVHRTGGLADTVVDTLPTTLDDGTASGLVFKEPHANTLLETIKRALLLYHSPELWRRVQHTAMQKDFSWQHSAHQYLALYRALR